MTVAVATTRPEPGAAKTVAAGTVSRRAGDAKGAVPGRRGQGQKPGVRIQLVGLGASDLVGPGILGETTQINLPRVSALRCRSLGVGSDCQRRHRSRLITVLSHAARGQADVIQRSLRTQASSCIVNLRGGYRPRPAPPPARRRRWRPPVGLTLRAGAAHSAHPLWPVTHRRSCFNCYVGRRASPGAGDYPPAPIASSGIRKQPSCPVCVPPQICDCNIHSK
jgi:hypothetical protein